MEDLMYAIIKSNDLVAARKLFAEAMAVETAPLLEARKAEIARSFIIEGEETDEDKEEKSDKKAKKSDEGADAGGDADEGDDEDDE